jgi:GNAT superfamily N-acetyltransferase
MHVLIRKATPEDCTAAAELLDELGYPTSSQEILNRIEAMESDPNGCLLNAIADGTCVGLASLHILPYFPTGGRICRVTALVVKSEFRGRGIGSKLLLEVERIARDAGCMGVEITAAVQRRETHEIYEHRGYVRASIRFFKRLD